MQIKFLNAQGAPLVDAVVAVSASPTPHHDIGLLTDAQGCIDLAVDQAGTWGFSVFHGGRAHSVQAQLGPAQASAEVRV